MCSRILSQNFVIILWILSLFVLLQGTLYHHFLHLFGLLQGTPFCDTIKFVSAFVIACHKELCHHHYLLHNLFLIKYSRKLLCNCLQFWIPEYYLRILELEFCMFCACQIATVEGLTYMEFLRKCGEINWLRKQKVICVLWRENCKFTLNLLSCIQIFLFSHYCVHPIFK